MPSITACYRFITSVRITLSLGVLQIVLALNLIDIHIQLQVINAMLAGAIPIVLAHSPSLVQLGLNPRSMVDCSEFGPRSTELSSSPASWSSADLDATLAR